MAAVIAASGRVYPPGGLFRSGAAIAAGAVLHADAVSAEVGRKGMAMYLLAVMSAGGTALLAIAVGGLLRNIVVFPRSRRSL